MRVVGGMPPAALCRTWTPRVYTTAPSQPDAPRARVHGVHPASTPRRSPGSRLQPTALTPPAAGSPDPGQTSARRGDERRPRVAWTPHSCRVQVAPGTAHRHLYTFCTRPPVICTRPRCHDINPLHLWKTLLTMDRLDTIRTAIRTPIPPNGDGGDPRASLRARCAGLGRLERGSARRTGE